MSRAIVLIVIAVLLGGCGTPRPKQAPEALSCGLERFAVRDVYDQWRIYRRSLLGVKSLEDAKPSFNVLALSAGGEFGAYGAAFLSGWRSLGDTAIPAPRTDIQVVTGVSTGAILATHAFLGKDNEIEDIYRKASGEKLYRERSLFEYLTANSLLDTKLKDRLIADRLRSEDIDQVARAGGRFLYIGLVDLDSGRFLRIDMVKLAQTIQPASLRDACYRAVIGASSAVPIAFAPKFVDDMMLVDGGARRHLFLTELSSEAKKPDVTRRLYSLVHGDLDVGCAETKNGVLQIAARTAELFTDQSFKDSLRLSHQLATEPTVLTPGSAPVPLFDTYYAAAAAAARVCAPKRESCKKPGGTLGEDQFCNAFMNCLADEGRKDGIAFARTGKWMEFSELKLSSQPTCKPGAALKAAPEMQTIRRFTQ